MRSITEIASAFWTQLKENLETVARVYEYPQPGREGIFVYDCRYSKQDRRGRSLERGVLILVLRYAKKAKPGVSVVTTALSMFDEIKSAVKDESAYDSEIINLDVNLDVIVASARDNPLFECGITIEVTIEGEGYNVA